MGVLDLQPAPLQGLHVQLIRVQHMVHRGRQGLRGHKVGPKGAKVLGAQHWRAMHNTDQPQHTTRAARQVPPTQSSLSLQLAL